MLARSVTCKFLVTVTKPSPVSPDATSIPLEALKIVERVKGVEPSLSA